MRRALSVGVISPLTHWDGVSERKGKSLAGSEAGVIYIFLLLFNSTD
jgi:hypothetical protein